VLGLRRQNHKQAVIGLHADMVEELRKLPPSTARVFSKGLPKMTALKADLRRAGIEFINAEGQRADFHSLRHSLDANLALVGTAPRAAMEAMRDSDIRLTTKTYTDTGLLPVANAVARLKTHKFTDTAPQGQRKGQRIYLRGNLLVRKTGKWSAEHRLA
jgi:hypothetical protein